MPELSANPSAALPDSAAPWTLYPCRSQASRAAANMVDLPARKTHNDSDTFRAGDVPDRGLLLLA